MHTEILQMTLHLHLNIYFIWLQLIFNQFKWCSVNTREDNTYLCIFLEGICMIYQRMSHWTEIIWKHNFSWEYTQTCSSCYTLRMTSTNLSCSSSLPLLFFFSPSLPPCQWHHACFHLLSDCTWFIWQAFNPVWACPSASGRKYPRACVSRTRSGSLSFRGCNLHLEYTPTNHIYSCAVRRCESFTQGEKCCGLYVSKNILPPYLATILPNCLFSTD